MRHVGEDIHLSNDGDLTTLFKPGQMPIKYHWRGLLQAFMLTRMKKRLCLLIVTIFIAAQGCALPERGPASVVSQSSKAGSIREDTAAAPVSEEAPAECVAAARAFIVYISRRDPDIAKDKEAQNRWLTEYLRRGLGNRQQVYADYLKRVQETPEQPPSNADFLDSWDGPTTYSIQGSRRYGERAVVDIKFSWGEKTQYPGDTRLVSYIFIREGDAWKLDDIYTFRGEFTAGARSLSETFWRNVFP